MAYQRKEIPRNLPVGDELTSSLVGIGMCFASSQIRNPSIEDTLIAASVEGVEGSDFRLLSVLTTWLGIHFLWINVDRLYRALKICGHERVYPYWAAIGYWQKKDRRFLRLSRIYSGKRVDLLPTESDFQIGRHGEDARFEGSPLRVPKGTLRDRRQDVLSPRDLAKLHTTYRQRVLQGPSYRADMWADIEASPELSAAELARRTYGSFATAWRVKKDWALLNLAA